MSSQIEKNFVAIETRADAIKNQAVGKLLDNLPSSLIDWLESLNPYTRKTFVANLENSITELYHAAFSEGGEIAAIHAADDELGQILDELSMKQGEKDD